MLLVEFPDNGQALERDAFYTFAVPLNILGLDSSWCRLFAVVERWATDHLRAWDNCNADLQVGLQNK